MFRKQMFTIAFIVLLSGLIINTMGCQQCKDFLEMPEKVKKLRKNWPMRRKNWPMRRRNWPMRRRN